MRVPRLRQALGSALPLAACTLLTSCGPGDAERPRADPSPSSSVRAPQEFALDLRPGAAYTASVWKVATSAESGVRAELAAQPPPPGSSGVLLLASHERDALVRIVRWPGAEAARAYAAAPGAGPRPARIRMFQLVDWSGKPGAARSLRMGDAVQWSEFLLREAKDAPTLSTMVTSMTAGMAEGGGAEGLRLISQLRSSDGMSIGLLGLWRDREGFRVFARQKTFGERGYWEPYATNEHWMMDVVAAR